MSITKKRGEYEVLVYPADTIGDGSQTVATAGTAVQLSSSETPCRWVIIVANSTNTGSIWIGGSNVAANTGRSLVALQSEKIEIDDLSKIYIDADNDGEGVHYMYVL